MCIQRVELVIDGIGKSVVRQCAILDGVKIQVGLKMKDAGSRCYPESDSME